MRAKQPDAHRQDKTKTGKINTLRKGEMPMLAANCHGIMLAMLAEHVE